MKDTRFESAIERIRTDYSEMPGLQLTFWQAQRLWDLSHDLCDGALRNLVRAGYLVRTRDGCYRRPNVNPQRSEERVTRQAGPTRPGHAGSRAIAAR